MFVIIRKAPSLSEQMKNWCSAVTSKWQKTFIAIHALNLCPVFNLVKTLQENTFLMTSNCENVMYTLGRNVAGSKSWGKKKMRGKTRPIFYLILDRDDIPIDIMG